MKFCFLQTYFVMAVGVSLFRMAENYYFPLLFNRPNFKFARSIKERVFIFICFVLTLEHITVPCSALLYSWS